MYNYSLKIDIKDSETPSSILYKDVVIKITAVDLEGCITKIKEIFDVQDSQIVIKAIGYVQQVLKIEEE